MLLAQVGDVVALDAQRQALEAERVAQALERLDARRAAAREALGLGLRGQLGVALRQLEQAALGAALGGAHRRRRRRAARPAPPPRSGASSSGATISRRDRRPVPVELEQELLEHLGRRRGPRRSPRRTPAGPPRRRRARGTPARWRPARPGAGRPRRTPRCPRCAPPGARARAARPRAGRAAAPPSRTPAPPRRPPSRARCRARRRSRRPRRKSTDLLRRPPCTPRACSGRRTGARERLMKYCRQGEPLGRPGLAPLALAVREDAPDELERDLAHLRALEYGPKYRLPGTCRPRKKRTRGHSSLQRDLDVRVALVVAQAQVVRRPRLLDEVVLEEERLALGRRDDPVQVARLGQHLGGAPVGRAALRRSRRRRACAGPSPCPRTAPRRRRRGSGTRRGRGGRAAAAEARGRRGRRGLAAVIAPIVLARGGCAAGHGCAAPRGERIARRRRR